MPKPRVFISYAHEGDRGFTPRLAFALGFYTDVFWDQRLQTGSWMPQLDAAITDCNYFLPLLSYTQTHESEPCKRELDLALEHSKSIIPLKVHENFSFSDADRRIRDLQGSDFTQGFDKGFLGLTEKILSQPMLPWEMLANVSDQDIRVALDNGLIPGIIGKSLVEWLVVERLWRFTEAALLEEYGDMYVGGLPRTTYGLYRQCQTTMKWLTQFQDFVNRPNMDRVSKIVQQAVEITKLNDDQHQAIGHSASEIAEEVRKYLQMRGGAKLNFSEVARVNNFFDFDVAETIRELITMHARRSRYLY